MNIFTSMLYSVTLIVEMEMGTGIFLWEWECGWG